MAFLIGTYNKYDSWDREHSKYVFEINEVWYAVKEVSMEWGLPQLRFRADQEQYPENYRIYDTYEDAMQFVYQMKQLAR